MPASGCTLPTDLADSLGADQKAARVLCLDQAKAGL
jgi:hypothetical protein